MKPHSLIWVAFLLGLTAPAHASAKNPILTLLKSGKCKATAVPLSPDLKPGKLEYAKMGTTYECDSLSYHSFHPGTRDPNLLATDLRLDLYLPNKKSGYKGWKNTPLIVWIPGGGYNQGFRRLPSPALGEQDLLSATPFEVYHFFLGLCSDYLRHYATHELGYAVACITPRFVPSNPVADNQYNPIHDENPPTGVFPGPIIDINRAVKWLKTNSQGLFNPDRIALWGESSGAHWAMVAGLSQGIPDLHESNQWSDPNNRSATAYDSGPSGVRAVVDIGGLGDAGSMAYHTAGTWTDLPSLNFLVHMNLVGKGDIFQTVNADGFKGYDLVDPSAIISNYIVPQGLKKTYHEPEFYIAHSRDDPDYPYDNIESFTRHLTTAGMPYESHPFDGYGHSMGHLRWLSYRYGALDAFLARTLKP